MSLIRLTKLIYKEATDEVLGMKLKAYVTLSNLRDADLSQQELCIATHMDANNCVLMLNHLEELDWIERRRDPADRRRHIVCLTEPGRKRLEHADAAMESLEGQVLNALSTDERDQLRQLVGRALTSEPVEA